MTPKYTCSIITEDSTTMATDLSNVNANPAYEAATPLQNNVAYEGIKAYISKPDETAEPVYDDVHPPMSTTTASGGNDTVEHENEYY